MHALAPSPEVRLNLMASGVASLQATCCIPCDLAVNTRTVLCFIQFNCFEELVRLSINCGCTASSSAAADNGIAVQ